MVDNILYDSRGKLIERILTQVASDLMQKQPIGPLEVGEIIAASLCIFHSHFDPKSTIKQLENELGDLSTRVATARAEAAQRELERTLDRAATMPVPDSSRH